MSAGYVTKILDPTETLNVLRQMPLVTGDLGKTQHPIEANRYSKDLLSAKVTAGAAPVAYEHVAKADRINFFDLLVDERPSKHLKLHLEASRISTEIMRGFRNRAGKTLRPIFYLPYLKNRTTRMKLEEPAGAGGGGEVQFFATATIDGCSVYIEGPAATPKVSHLNAAAVAPPVAGETEAHKLGRIQQKSNTMDQRIGFIKKGPATVVERTNYIEDTAAGQATMRNLFAHRHHLPAGQVTKYDPFGAVVGVKSGGAWTFYLQKCGNFEFRRKPGSPVETAFMVIEARECWPNGGGAFRTLP